MILFYIDESGTGLKDRRAPCFILTSVAADAANWVEIEQAITALKRNWVSYASAEDFEIKGRHIRQGLEFFKNMSWERREDIIRQVTNCLYELPCRIFAVCVDKRELPPYIETEDDLYRLAFWRLLDEQARYLSHTNESGMLMMDARSDLHSSVQDRRLVKSFSEWTRIIKGEYPSPYIELPWFGFSAFYAGLQLADFAAYLLDCNINGRAETSRDTVFRESYMKLTPKLLLSTIP